MLKINKLHAGYGKLQVLFGVDIKAQEGTISVIIGPNGAGKSTVVKSIFGLTDRTSGKITFVGKDITKLPAHELIKLGISYVPQGRQVFGSLTVQENLEMGAYLEKDKAIIEERIKVVLEQFPDLKPKLDDLASSLSGGQQQMLAMGRALVQKPTLLLLDEPSAGLSPKLVHDIFKKVKDINKQGVTIVIVEQNAKQAIKIADQVYVLEEGKVALFGGKKILSNKKLQKIYLGGHGHD